MARTAKAKAGTSSGSGNGGVAVTALRLGALRWLGECGMLTTTQWRRAGGYTPKQLYKYAEALREGGYLRSVAMPVQLMGAAPPDPKAAGLQWGRTEHLHLLTRAGARLLADAGLLDPDRHVPEFDPGNTLFVAHEVAVRQVRVRFAEHARAHGREVTEWSDGPAAHVVPGPDFPQLPAVRSDARLCYRTGGTTGRGDPILLFAFVEADRGTERPEVWKDKAARYGALLAGTGEAGTPLEHLTGHRAALVLVTVPDAKRRDAVAAAVAPYPASDRYRIAAAPDFDAVPLDAKVWRVPGRSDPRELVPTRFL